MNGRALRTTWVVVACLSAMGVACGSSTPEGVDPGTGDPGVEATDVAVEATPEIVETVEAVEAIETAIEVPSDVAGEEVSPVPTAELSAGGAKLTVDAAAKTVGLTFDGALRTTLPVDGLQLGIVTAIDDLVNYDPYPLALDDGMFTPPDGLAWLSVTAMEVFQPDAGTIEVRLAFEQGRTATLTLTVNEPGSFKAKLLPTGDASTIAYLRVRPRVDPTEEFYGLGAFLDQVHQRGTVRSMQMELDGTFESANNEAHVPIPLLIGTHGWGMFVETRYVGSFDVGKKAADVVESTWGTGAASKDGLTFHLFAAAKALDITHLYYDVAGQPILPAKWALGPWIWRDELDESGPGTAQAQVHSDLNKIRDLDLATSAYWIDRPYANGVNSFDFHKVYYTDPAAMIQEAHDLGFRVALWHTPYISEKGEQSDETKALLKTATDQDDYPPVVGLLLNKWGRFIDFTKPEAFAWWQSLIAKYTVDLGIEGFKMDYGEDVVPGLIGGRNVYQFHDGSDERTMHSMFKIWYHRVYAEMLPKTGGFLLCRAGTWGDQKNVSVIWPGDLDATFWKHGDTFQDGTATNKAVGGLPASMIYGITLGPSGFPFYGADTGGYRHSPPDKELFIRWFEQTALSTVMQVGTSTNNVAWEFDAANGGFDQEVLDLYRQFTRLHLRLFPYEWTYAQNLAKDGRAIERPVGLVYPETGVHPDDEYLFGDHLLVAPVLEAGATGRDVYFPPASGTWMDWFTGDLFAGGQSVHVNAPLGALPLYIQAGGIVPLLRPTIDTTAPTTQPDRVDSYATDPGVLYPVVYPGPATTFPLYDGSEAGQALADKALTLSWKDGSEFKAGAQFEVLGVATLPAGVKLDGATLAEIGSTALLAAQESGWVYDSTAKRLYVKVPAGTHAAAVTL